MKRLKQILFFLAIIAIAVLLILNNFLIYGIVLIAIYIGAYMIWNLFIRKMQEEISELRKRSLEQKELIDDLKGRKINVEVL